MRAESELQAICRLLETQELAHSRVGLRGADNRQLLKSMLTFPVKFLSSRRGKLGVEEPPLPTIPYCLCGRGWGGGEDRQVGGAVDRWLSEWDPFQPACVNLQVTPQRDTCRCEHHPRTGVLFPINLVLQ